MAGVNMLVYRCFRKACLVFLLGTLFSTSACELPSRESRMPFETIENRDASGTGQYFEDREPGLMVISSNEDFFKIGQLVTDAAKTRLTTLNLEKYFILLVFQGWKPSGGYVMKIENITRSDQAINVYAQFLEPQEDEGKTDEVSSPYELVQVEKGSLDWNNEFTMNLVVDGEIVFTISQFIP